MDLWFVLLIIKQVSELEKEKLEQFWKVNSYVAGSYDKETDFKNLDLHLTRLSATACRLFYLALPPSVYETVSSKIKAACMTKS